MAIKKVQYCFLSFLLVATLSFPVAAANAQSPFVSLPGTWSGNGSVRLTNGKSERLRCKAYYTRKSGGSGLGMSIRCASPGNKFFLRAQLKNSGGVVSGSWTETNYNATGNLNGKASANKLSLAIKGGISGYLSVSVNGRSQKLSLMTKGNDAAFRGVKISLRKRS